MMHRFLKYSSAAILLALMPAAVRPVLARRRTLNWHLEHEHRARRKKKSAPPKPRPARLMPGRWTPAVRAAIDRLIARKGKLAPGYDSQRPPVAVLPWSDALVGGDPAELVFLRLVSDVEFKVDDDWWDIVPIAYGRQPIRAAYEQFIGLPRSVWKSQPGYMAWRKGMLSSYLDLCRHVGRKECRSYLAELWAGWREDDAEAYAAKALDDEMNTPATSELVPGQLGDPKPLRARRGLRVIPEMRDLVAKLRASGFDVWVVDDVPQPVLEASTTDYGVDPSRVYGIVNSTDGPRLGADVVLPVPTRGGKTAIVQTELGRPPDFALGRDAADLNLLSYGDGLRVVLDGDPDLVRKARERGWLVQPSLAR
jgi:phosphoserine phosphatase